MSTEQPGGTGGLEHDDVVRLLMHNYSLIRAYVGAIVRDLDLAEEVAQEASVVIIRKAAQMTTAELFPKWARGVARNEALRLLRDQRRRSRRMAPEVVEVMEGAWAHWDGSKKMHDRREVLKQCLAKLTAKAREILKLKYEKGFSGIEIAKRLGRRVEGVYVTLSRLHKNLSVCVRSRLQEDATR